MVTAIKEIPIMDETIFRADSSIDNSRHIISLKHDSYIWCFEGRRGGGKTTTMTYFVVRAVALYNMKVVANYPIEFMLRRHRPDGKTYLQHVKSEPLDFEKLICFDEGYKHLLICIDEAPDIISHMASQTWRNRLVAAFTRQIRKNYNTLFIATQDFNLVDKSMRWQVDINVKCRDAARHLGTKANLERGEMLWLQIYDQSGQWTGSSTEDRIRQGKKAYVAKKKLFPRVMWGDDVHKPVFDSWFQLDILESLRKVDVRMSSIQIGDKVSGQYDMYPVRDDTLQGAYALIETVMAEMPENPVVEQKKFYKAIGADGDKYNLGRILADYNAERGGHGEKRLLVFTRFNLEGFREYVVARVDNEK